MSIAPMLGNPIPPLDFALLTPEQLAALVQARGQPFSIVPPPPLGEAAGQVAGSEDRANRAAQQANQAALSAVPIYEPTATKADVGDAPARPDPTAIRTERPDVAPELTTEAPKQRFGEDIDKATIGSSLATAGEAAGGDQEDLIKAVLFGLGFLNSRGNLAEAFAEGLGNVGAAYEVHRSRREKEITLETGAERVRLERDRLAMEKEQSEAVLGEQIRHQTNLERLSKSDKMLGTQALLTERQRLKFGAEDKAYNAWWDTLIDVEKLKEQAAAQGLTKAELQARINQMHLETYQRTGKTYLEARQAAYNGETSRIAANASASAAKAAADSDKDKIAAQMLMKAHETWSTGTLYGTEKRSFVKYFGQDLLPAIQQSPVLAGMFKALTEEQVTAMLPAAMSAEEKKGFWTWLWSWGTGAGDKAAAGTSGPLVGAFLNKGAAEAQKLGKGSVFDYKGERYLLGDYSEAQGGFEVMSMFAGAKPAKPAKPVPEQPAPTPKPTTQPRTTQFVESEAVGRPVAVGSKEAAEQHSLELQRYQKDLDAIKSADELVRAARALRKKYSTASMTQYAAGFMALYSARLTQLTTAK